MMFDPSDDFATVTDGLEPVTIARPGGSDKTEVAHAMRRNVRTREAAESAGRYTASDVVWHLPASELAAAPRPGDLAIDAEGRRWTVLDVQSGAGAGRWRCVCRNLAVFHGLDGFVDVEKAAFTKGLSGAERATWSTWRTGVRARIQPARIEIETAPDRRRTVEGFRVVLAEDLAVDHRHRIKAPDGSRYRVVRCRKAERIDGLMEIDVIRCQ